MNNKVGFNRLGVRTGHRRALKRNMVISLLKHEQITTTKAKAKEIRRLAEKLITRAKLDTVHNRRQVARLVHDKAILVKLFNDLGKRYESRPGGYTRMVKMGFRRGDAAELVILELLDRNTTGSATVKDVKPATAKKPEKTEPSNEVSGDEEKKAAKTSTKATQTKRSSSTKVESKTTATASAKKVQRGSSQRGK